MANKKISQYTEALSVGNDDLFDISVDLGGGVYETRSVRKSNLGIGGSASPWGIYDASGALTGYATYALAQAAAVSGETIHMFTDVTETGAVECILKDGVDINLNGNIYTLNVATTEDAFTDNNIQVACSIFNGTIKREGGTFSTVNSLGLHVDNSNSEVILNGVVIESSFGCTASVDGKLTGGKFISGAGTVSYSCSSLGEVSDASIYAVNGARLSGDARNIFCRVTTGTALDVRGTGEYHNLLGISLGSYGIFSNSGCKVYNSTGISFASYGIFAGGNGKYYSCHGYSSALVGFLSNSINGEVIDCSGVSDGNYAFGISGKAFSCFAQSSVSQAVRLNNDAVWHNGEAESTWNNASGHAYYNSSSTSGLAGVYNSLGKVANASANGVHCIGSTYNIRFGNNTFEGCTLILNTGTAGVVNLQTNAPDTEGNILVG
jgi:hypothetical protein